MRFTQIRNTYVYFLQCSSEIVLFTEWRHEGSAADQMEELSDGVKKDLSLYDECACQIKDNLIMFTGSSFNLTDYIMACASELDVYVSEIVMILLYWIFVLICLFFCLNKLCCHTVNSSFLCKKLQHGSQLRRGQAFLEYLCFFLFFNEVFITVFDLKKKSVFLSLLKQMNDWKLFSY